MNLYLIRQDANDGYGIYRSAVVCANSTEEARSMSPASGEPIDWAGQSRWDADQWVSRPDDVIVELIGQAVAQCAHRHVVCACYVEG